MRLGILILLTTASMAGCLGVDESTLGTASDGEDQLQQGGAATADSVSASQTTSTWDPGSCTTAGEVFQDERELKPGDTHEVEFTVGNGCALQFEGALQHHVLSNLHITITSGDDVVFEYAVGPGASYSPTGDGNLKKTSKLQEAPAGTYVVTASSDGVAKYTLAVSAS